MTLKNRNNIKRIFEQATPDEIKEGIVWYAEAQAEAQKLAKKYQIDLHCVVGVIAALSPNNKWKRNVTDAATMISQYLNGFGLDSFKVSTYNAMKLKAWRILEESYTPKDTIEILNGQKIISFYRCIMGDRAGVCIDGHARNIYYNERVGLTENRTNIGKKEYQEISNAYASVAYMLSGRGKREYHAYEVQAITWTVWRRLHNIK